jgi:hypothetical protein
MVNDPDPPRKPDRKTYRNTKKDFGVLEVAATSARHLGLVAPHVLVDRRNPEPQIHAVYGGLFVPSWEMTGETLLSLPHIETDLVRHISLDLPSPEVFGYDYDQSAQPYHLEVWVEKSTQNDVLEPICRALHANFVPSVGMQSITSAVRMLLRLDHLRRVSGDKPVRIFYISDFDPAGLIMPVSMARQIEFYLDHYAPGADIKLNPIVLTKQQVIDYALPRIPIEDEDVRKGNFEDRHGEGRVELDALDALHPGALERIVREAVDPYRDKDLEDAFADTAKEAQQLAAYKEHKQEEMAEQRVYTCEVCQATFTPAKSDCWYCSKKCKEKAKWQRQKAKLQRKKPR